MLPKGTLGPGILGEELYESELVQTTKGRGIFGPGITGEEPDPEPAPKEEPEESKPVPAPISLNVPHLGVAKLKDLINGNIEFLDGAIETEFTREPGPRKGALRYFLEIEGENQGREDVVARLGKALG